MDLIKMFSTMQGMASLSRYSQTRLMAPESVLQHSGFVVLTCYFIGLELNSVANAKTEEIPMSELLARAAVHDLEEIAVGDISRPTKYHSAETIAMFSMLKGIGIRKVVHELHLPPRVEDIVLDDHARAKDGRSGFVVDLADKAAVVYKLWDECLLRNNYTMIKNAVHLRERNFLPHMRQAMASLQFNPEQALYLHSLISTLTELIGLVAAKKNHVHGVMNEAL